MFFLVIQCLIVVIHEDPSVVAAFGGIILVQFHDDPDALFLEKMYLVETCLELIDAMYKAFLGVRLSGDWKDEVSKVRQWMQA